MKLNLFYREAGTNNTEHILILHGLLGMSDNWVNIGKKLSEKHHVIIPDLRDHGQSPHTSQFEMENICKDIYTLLKDKGINKCSIIGHSIGGKITMGFASLYNDFVKDLIIVDTTPFALNKKSTAKFISQLYFLDLTKFKRREEIFLTLDEKKISRNWQKQIVKNIKFNSFGNYEWKPNLKTINKSNIYKYTLPDEFVFNGRCLFIKGKLSKFIDLKRMPEIKKIFPNAELCEIENAGHWVHADNETDFTKAITDFLK